MPNRDAPTRSIWRGPDDHSVTVIDQTHLPHRYVERVLRTVDDVAHAIQSMVVRGAPLIGATAAYGVCFGVRSDPSNAALDRTIETLRATRPTAVNLHHALAELAATLADIPERDRADVAFARADAICNEDIRINAAIGEHGREIIQHRAAEHTPVQILTHCNAGRLATVAWGTALAPVYLAHNAGIPVHVWVSETRPRNQGAALTAWELDEYGVPYTVIADNAAGHLIQRGLVDLVLTGTDRTLPTGDVCNKIGTYLKALAAYEHDVPFYAAVPSPSIDWALYDPLDIPIEERDAREVTTAAGLAPNGEQTTIQLTPSGAPAVNYAFDVTPAKLVTGLITERGMCAASPDGLRSLFPEQFADAYDAYRANNA